MFQFRSARITLFIFLLINLFVFSAFSQTLIGKVVGISDGDTFKLLVQDSILHKIRVANIDCPEKKQPFSNKAKQELSIMIFNKQVRVDYASKDRYVRIQPNLNFLG